VRFYESLHQVLTRAWGGGSSQPFLSAGLDHLGLRRRLPVLRHHDDDHHLGGHPDQARVAHPALALANFETAVLWVLPWLFSIGMVYLLYKYMPTRARSVAAGARRGDPVGIVWEARQAGLRRDGGRQRLLRHLRPDGRLCAADGRIYISSVIVLFGAEYAAAWRSSTTADTRYGGRY
jgi:hypothetical protein